MHSSMIPFSVIIPVKNGSTTLSLCIESIRSSSKQPAEIIVVDDGSTDNSGGIAVRHGCRLLNVSIGKGPMQPRFAGAREAVSPLLVFLDSDVLVKPDTFERLTQHFSKPDVSAVTGLLTRSSRIPGFFTQYKNEYMNFVFSGRSADAGFLYGSIFAVTASDFIFFEPVNDPFGCIVSDSELGILLKARGKRIVLDHELEVEHLKRYSLLTLMRNDFKIPFMFARIFPRYSRRSRWVGGRSFSHASLGQTAAASACAAAWIIFFFGVLLRESALLGTAALLWSAFYLYWGHFIRRAAERGFLFAAACAVTMAVDAAVMFLGMCAGFLYNAYSLIFRIDRNSIQFSTLPNKEKQGASESIPKAAGLR